MALMALRAADLNFAGLTIGGRRRPCRTLPSLSFFSSVSGTRTSPAMTTRLVVARVSQATRTCAGIHAGLLGLAEDQVDDLVGDAVANLVGMTLGDRFRGEEIGGPQGETPKNCPKTRKSRGSAGFLSPGGRRGQAGYKESLISRRPLRGNHARVAGGCAAHGARAAGRCRGRRGMASCRSGRRSWARSC